MADQHFTRHASRAALLLALLLFLAFVFSWTDTVRVIHCHTDLSALTTRHDSLDYALGTECGDQLDRLRTATHAR